MQYFLKQLSTNKLSQTTKLAVWLDGTWDGGNERITDPTGQLFITVQVADTVELTTTAVTNYQAAQQRKAATLLKKGNLQAALKAKGII